LQGIGNLKSSLVVLMRHGVDNVKHHPVGNPKRKVWWI
jgi:hypothetical protein